MTLLTLILQLFIMPHCCYQSLLCVFLVLLWYYLSLQERQFKLYTLCSIHRSNTLTCQHVAFCLFVFLHLFHKLQFVFHLPPQSTKMIFFRSLSAAALSSLFLMSASSLFQFIISTCSEVCCFLPYNFAFFSTEFYLLVYNYAIPGDHFATFCSCFLFCLNTLVLSMNVMSPHSAIP